MKYFVAKMLSRRVIGTSMLFALLTATAPLYAIDNSRLMEFTVKPMLIDVLKRSKWGTDAKIKNFAEVNTPRMVAIVKDGTTTNEMLQIYKSVSKKPISSTQASQYRSYADNTNIFYYLLISGEKSAEIPATYENQCSSEMPVCAPPVLPGDYDVVIRVYGCSSGQMACFPLKNTTCDTACKKIRKVLGQLWHSLCSSFGNCSGGLINQINNAVVGVRG